MKLNHIGITVMDVSQARVFLETYFDLCGIGKNNHHMTHLQDDSELILSLFKGLAITEPETTHIGFMQETEAQENAIYKHLKEDGFEVELPQRSHGWTFYIVAPGGFAIEVAS